MLLPCGQRPGKALLLYYSTNSVEEQSRFRKMNFCCQKFFCSFDRNISVLAESFGNFSLTVRVFLAKLRQKSILFIFKMKM